MTVYLIANIVVLFNAIAVCTEAKTSQIQLMDSKLPCVLHNGCVCNHSKPYINPSDDQTYGTCISCNEKYTGPTCDRRSVKCLNQGNKLSNGTCHCPLPWTGTDCAERVCINSKGPNHTLKPNPKTNFCDQCLPGYHGLSCDMCSSDKGCPTDTHTCDTEIAPVINSLKMQCNVTSKSFLSPLGSGRDVEGMVKYDCDSPSKFAEGHNDGKCTVAFYRIEPNRAFIDPFFFCTGFKCGVTRTTTKLTTTDDEEKESARKNMFAIFRDGGQVVLLGLCFSVGFSRYLPATPTSQRVAVKVSVILTIVVLFGYIVIMFTLMSTRPTKTEQHTIFTCQETACQCGKDPSSEYTPFCSNSMFGKYILPLIIHKNTLTCNDETRACIFQPEDMRTEIPLSCTTSQCVPKNMSRRHDVHHNDITGEHQGNILHRSSYIILGSTVFMVGASILIHLAYSVITGKRARREFIRTYFAYNSGMENDEGIDMQNGNVNDTRVTSTSVSSQRELATILQSSRSSRTNGGDEHAIENVNSAPLYSSDLGSDEDEDESRPLKSSPSPSSRVCKKKGSHNSNHIIASDSPQSEDEPVVIPHISLENCHLEVRDVSYNVYPSSWPFLYSSGNEMKILQDINLTFNSGDVVALMGPSGAGKTTLLDILAARAKSGKLNGDMKLNGSTITELKKYRNLVGYVAQEDTLLPSLTVRQTILYAAQLKLPTAFRASTREIIVDALITSLRLTRCAHTIIGDGSTSRGVSGGEKRRVSIAVELVANPRILFLDEPTSGLDASSALRVMETLSILARTSPLRKYAPNFFSFNPIIIASIHQPSNVIFSKFNKIVLLSRGCILYYGRRDMALSSLAERLSGTTSSVLRGALEGADNPAEVLLSIDEMISDEERQEIANISRDIATSRGSPTTDEYNTGDGVPRTGVDSNRISIMESVDESKRYYIHCYSQAVLLTKRSVSCLFGAYYLVTAHCFVAFFMGGLMCQLYSYQPLDLPGSLNRAGSVTFLLLVQSFMALSVLEQLMTERKLFVTEKENGFYSTLPYLVSKILVDVVPLRIFPALLVGSVIYFPMGLRTDFGTFFLWFLLILVIFTVVITLVIICIGVMSNTFGSAVLISAVFILWNFVFGGILVQADTIPSMFQPFRRMSPFYLAFEALLVNELDGQMCSFAPVDAAGIPTSTVIPLYCSQYLANLGLHSDNFGRDVAILIIEMLGLVFVSWGLLTQVSILR